MPEQLIQLLADLPLAESDPARADRIKVVCRARLARRAAHASALDNPAPRRTTTQVWLPLTVVLAVAYLSQAVVQALRVFASF